jgi:uroporphyrin-III C-methyltransferase / precorrin-2 dehydrogenase / sirohydrochlorin ferrochelatase
MSAPRRPVEATSPRLGELARLPVFYALQGKRAVVAGGSAAAAWKAELLAAAGAHVEIYAADVSDELLQLANERPSTIALHRRAWDTGDFQNAAIAVGAFQSGDDSAAFAAGARAAGVPVNVIDKPTFCDFAFGAIVNRSPLVIGISTDGAAPVFSQAIRAKLEALFPKGFAVWAAAAARWRHAVKLSGLSFSARRKFWQLLTAHAIARPDAEPTPAQLGALMAQVKGLGTAVEHGSVTLVGAGPGDPELLTLRAVRALQSADVILFDDLVSREVLDFARREARKMLVGKRGFGPSCKQEEINSVMVALARQGKRVVRLKGGDPLIFGRAGEEIAACEAADVAVDIIPGITAAQGAAASLHLPLTNRKHARRVQYVTGHAQDGGLPSDLDWAGIADPTATTAIYMPTRTLHAFVAQAIERGLDPKTPALAISRATRHNQRTIRAPLAELHEHVTRAALPGPTLVMFGQVLAKQMEERADAQNGIAAA